MARIPEHIIENVRQVADIYDIVSEHVNLKKRGRNFFGLCPFHNEKTPSLQYQPLFLRVVLLHSKGHD